MIKPGSKWVGSNGVVTVREVKGNSVHLEGDQTFVSYDIDHFHNGGFIKLRPEMRLSDMPEDVIQAFCVLNLNILVGMEIFNRVSDTIDRYPDIFEIGEKSGEVKVKILFT